MQGAIVSGDDCCHDFLASSAWFLGVLGLCILLSFGLYRVALRRFPDIGHRPFLIGAIFPPIPLIALRTLFAASGYHAVFFAHWALCALVVWLPAWLFYSRIMKKPTEARTKPLRKGLWLLAAFTVLSFSYPYIHYSMQGTIGDGSLIIQKSD